MKFHGALALLLLSACGTAPQPQPTPSPSRPPEVILSSYQMAVTLRISQLNKIRAISPEYMAFKVITQHRPDHLVVVYCPPTILCNDSVPTWEHPHFAFELADDFAGTPDEKLRPKDTFAILFPARTAGKRTWCWPHNVGYLYENNWRLLSLLSQKLQQAEPWSYKRSPYKIEDTIFWCATVFN